MPIPKLKTLLPLTFFLTGISLALAQTHPAATAPTSHPASAPATAAASAPALAPAHRIAVTGDMPDLLKKQIADAVAALDEQRYTDFIESLAPPDELRAMKAGDFAQVITHIAQEAPKIRAMLVSMADKTPTLGADDKGHPQATFPKPENADDGQPTFVLIDGNWRVD